MRSFAVIVLGAVLMLSALAHQADTSPATDGAAPQSSAQSSR